MQFFYSKQLVAALAIIMVMLMFSLPFLFTSVDRDTLAEAMPAVEAPSAAESAPIERAVTDDVLWLARVIYSETKRPYEQELVAWTVRNRVETAYRGNSTYQSVVLDPWQFSAFNRNAPKRAHYTGLNATSQAAGWATAIQIAQDVIEAPAYERPFVQTTRHFYSERSMVGRSQPAWANGKRPVDVGQHIDPRRFRFFANIA